jgi:exosortase/archaeosortase family protein
MEPPEKRSWMATHGRDLRFLLVFAILMGVYYAATTTAAVKEQFFPWYLTLNADASVGVLHASGIDYVNRIHHSLNSSFGSITVERGCDAVEPTALFVAAVLASPVRMMAKLPAVLVGTLVLAVVNLVRIVSLFLSAVYWRSAFNILHLDVWQAAFILLAIVMWAWWASWAVRRQTGRIHATP